MQKDIAYAAICVQNKSQRDFLCSLVNAEVIVKGMCHPSNTGLQPRRYLGPFISALFKTPDCITIVTSPPKDPFLAPEAEEGIQLPAPLIQQQGRRKIKGRVLAVWGGSNILLETRSNRHSRIELSSNGHLPDVDSFVEAVGSLDTDVYRLNLTRAIWRQTGGWPTTNAVAVATSAAEILTDGKGNPHVDIQMYGRLIELDGCVQILPGEGGADVICIDNNGYSIPIDVSSCHHVLDTLSIGCRIRATGVCLLNIGNYRPNDVFPQVNGFTLVVRNADDIVVLSRPSWWTARRLGFVLVAVLLVLIVILVWNRSLSVLAEHRGRQLAEEQVGRVTSELKVLERTRFSAELHDALSQTLSGIAMQLGAIKRLARTDPAQMLHHLDVASRTLKSCRDEMRNLLWDLRSQVLDEPDIEKALRQILGPHLEETEVHIRFAVPRTRLTDSTARALFCIVRELTVNAIRHGHASVVRIAGSLENGRLLCSIRDNGCGFDPSTAPGAEEGHFGLQGIRERMDAMNGTVTIESSRDRGTKVTISLAAPHEEEKT